MKRLAIVFILSTVSPSLVLADSDCSQVIQDCNVALDKCDATIKARDNTIALQSQALSSCQASTLDLGVKLEGIEARQSNILHNPLFDGAIGAVLGILIFSYVGKR